MKFKRKKGHYYLNVKSKYTVGYKQSAPVKCKVEKDIKIPNIIVKFLTIKLLKFFYYLHIFAPILLFKYNIFIIFT